MPDDALKLKRLRLVNFRKFGGLSIDFDDRLTVLIGDNGSGKTAVLDAAAIALGAFLIRVNSPHHTIVGRGVQASDMRLRSSRTGSVISNQPQPLEIQAAAVFRNDDVVWSRTMNESSRRQGGMLRHVTQASQALQREITEGGKTSLPLFAYYGTGRLWLHKRDRQYSEGFFSKGFSRANGYIDCLDYANNEKLMLNWFERMTQIELQKQQLGVDCRIPELDAVREALARCFTDLTGRRQVSVIFDLSVNSLMLVDSDDSGSPQMLPFENLSDGYRNTLSLIADIAYRMAMLNPDAEHILDSPGVVLIDEIDLHLHPKWQERIIHDLITIFPRVQFIVSSHAPSVISSVKSTHLRGIRQVQVGETQTDVFGNPILSDGLSESERSLRYTAYIPTVESYGHNAGTVLEDIMGANDRPSSVKRELSRFHHALDTGNLAEAEARLSSLENELGNDPDLVAGRVSLDLERLDGDDALD
ncbi:AAA family ATPase [Bifidobacterium catulorum]|uniref:ATP-binding protein n=1 Tax=Bifidobacterium catulorum TaxID=1630173 RepID=A0A2U2MSP7_9BIFI|nr:AAA family ATPase [Bifidobacterium catulorum]PWG59877.1 hypothetical protein DF200_05535 [Bifidobacterium catulorum]